MHGWICRSRSRQQSPSRAAAAHHAQSRMLCTRLLKTESWSSLNLHVSVV